jgi:hypothetical protein
VRQRVVPKVDQLELGVAASGGDVEYPGGDLFAVSVRAGAAEDDADPGHVLLLCVG